MTAASILPWLIFIHVVAAFAFVLAHGVSAFVAFGVRAERDPVRIGALLDLSAGAIGAVYVSLLVLLAAGIAAGVVGGQFGRAWIWLSLGLLIAIAAVMYPLATAHFGRLREAVGQRPAGGRGGMPESGETAAEAPRPTPAELDALLANRRPELIAAVGGSGFVTILALMVFKPL